MEDKTKHIIVAFIFALFVAGGGYELYAMYKKSVIDAPARAKELATLAPETKIQFDAVLKIFLDDVNTGITAYKDERKVLVEALNPLNLREPEYVEENYMMVQNLAPSLRTRMEVVMQKFADTEEKINALLVNEKEEARQATQAQWTELKETQGKIYADFFATERDLLTAYQDLMAFYYTNRNDFEVDMSGPAVVFGNVELNTSEKQMRDRIKELYVRQSEMLGKKEQAPAEPAPQP